MRRAKQLESKAATLRLNEWRVRLGANDGGTPPKGAAYRWLKGPTGWQPSPLGDDSRDRVPVDPEDEVFMLDDDDAVIAESNAGQHTKVPLCDQSAVELEAKEWAKLRQEGKEYVGPDMPQEPEMVQALMPGAIAAAAATFPIATGLGADNIAPRAFGRLSAQALVALTALFLAFEQHGTWCEVLDLVLIVLLPKGEGGFRPIGLFPTVIRLWMRTRI